MSIIFAFVMFAAKRHSSGDMPPGLAIFLGAVAVIALIIAVAYQTPPAISHRNTRCVDRAGKYFLEYAA